MTLQIERREVGNLLMEGIPEIPKPLSEKVNQYLQTRAATVLDWSPDGRSLLVLTRFGETPQIHRVESPGAQREQLTFFDEPVTGGRSCPDPARNGLIFLKDHGGSEYYQYYFFDLGDSSYRQLTDDQAKNGICRWSRAGDRFVYASTARNGVDHDLYLRFLDEPQRVELLWEGDGYWYPLDWSPDDRQLLIGLYRSINESYLYLLDLASGRIVQIREADDPQISYGAALWSSDGSKVYFCSDHQSEFQQLKVWERSSGRFTTLTEQIPWDLQLLSMSPDGQHLAFTINENGASRLYLLDTGTERYREVRNIPLGQIGNLSWHPGGRQLAMTIDTSQQPGDAYVLELAELKLTQWTFSEVGGLAPDQFVEPQLIHYPTFDEVDGQQRQIPAFYYRPQSGDRPHPVLIYIHGGPESQYQPTFSPTFQYYLQEMGIAVLAPNVRGSSGYGKSFVRLDNGYKREDSVRDIGSLLDWIDRQPELDSHQVAVIGGSYGGYMVLASMTHYNHRLCCGIDIVGISNFVTFLKNTKSYRRDLRRVEYGDERDPQMRAYLYAISPTTNAHKISKPILIVQGLNDPRVPASEAEQMLAAIRQNGGEAWYLLAKDEGHGFRKKSNRDFYTKAVMLFLQQYLLCAR